MVLEFLIIIIAIITFTENYTNLRTALIDEGEN